MENSALRVIWDNQKSGETWANHPISTYINLQICHLIQEGEKQGFSKLNRQYVAGAFGGEQIGFGMGIVTIGGHHVALHNIKGERMGIIVSCHPDFN